MTAEREKERKISTTTSYSHTCSSDENDCICVWKKTITSLSNIWKSSSFRTTYTANFWPCAYKGLTNVCDQTIANSRWDSRGC